MTNFEKRAMEIEKAKKTAQYNRERKSRLRDHIATAEKKARDAKGKNIIKPGINAFCMSCKKVVPISELVLINEEPWVCCYNCKIA